MSNSSGAQLQSNGRSVDDLGARLIHYGVLGLALIILVVLGIWHVAAGLPAALQLHINLFGLLSVVAFICNLIVFGMIARIKQRTEALMWFSVFLASIMMWAGGEALSSFSATAQAALFWLPATTPGLVMMPVSLYMFALAYTDSKHRLHILTLPCLLSVALMLAYLDLHSRLITIYDPAQFTLVPWGYVRAPGPAVACIVLWASLLPVAAVGHLYRFRRTAVDPQLRRQAQLFMIAICVPLVGGVITDGLPPLLHVHSLPSMAVILMTIMSILIGYGILRYRFLSFTPSLIANQILDTMNEAVLGVQPDLRIAYANSGAEQLLGLPASQLREKRLSTFISERPTMAQLRGDIHTALGHGSFGTIDAVRLGVVHRPATTAKLSITKLDDDSQPYGYLVVMTDITAMTDAAAMIERQVDERTHQLHEAQAKLQASIESLELGFALLDDHNAVVIQNQALEKTFGLDTPATTVQALEHVLSDVSLSDHCDKVRRTGRPAEVKEAGLGAKVLHLYMAPVKVAEHGKTNVIGTVLLVQDITEEKVLARSRDEFFSIASHELRTPLTSIKGNASIMIDFYKALLDKDATLKEMVYDIHASSARLIEIVSDFLDVSRIEQGKMTFRPGPVSIEKIIESVFYEMRAIVNEKQVELVTNTRTLGTLPQVWADHDRVMQIIYNLVGNALKFTDQGSVTVQASVEGRFIYLRVSDTGRGIPAQNQKLLFHKFQQAGDSLLTRDTTRGTGLGLYISKLMAEAMGGTIKLERSAEGKGSVFLVTLPIASKEQLRSADKPGAPQEQVDVSTGLSR